MDKKIETKRISGSELEASGVILYLDELKTVLEMELKGEASQDALQGFIAKNNISEGVDFDAIDQAFDAHRSGDNVGRIVIAKGKVPKMGKDGYLNFLIDMSEKKHQVTDENGNVDYRDTNMMKEVSSGQKILEVIPPFAGEEGVSIYGRRIQVEPGKKARISLGKNVAFTEDNKHVVAAVDGHVEFEEPLVSVLDEFVVNKDVDFTIGNLKFIGSLVIKGNVPSGYTIEAGKNITIEGISNGCNLFAKGDIIVKNGYGGSDKSRIECEGTLSGKYLQQATVFAKAGIKINSEIINSKVETCGVLSIEHGSIRGGEVSAFKGVVAKELGAPMGTSTTVIVGVDPTIDGRIEQLKGGIKKLETDMGKLQEAIAPFMKNKLMLMKAPEEKKAAVKTILTKIETLKGKIQKIEEMIQQLEQKRYDKTREIRVTGKMLDDITVKIGNKQKKFPTNRGRTGIICYDKTNFEILIRKL